MVTSNSFTKGLHTDTLPKFQPEGTYRYALNAVLETRDGELPSVSNEEGNYLCARDFPLTKSVIGSKLMDNDEVVLFLYDPDGDHEIGIFNPNSCLYTSVAIGSCLNFSLDHQINALFRIRNGCERVIYFTDNYNSYRVINLTDTTDWVSGGNVISCNRIQYSRDYFPPCISLFIGEGDIGIHEGDGVMELGVYYFAFRYLDKELNPTGWIMATRPVAIADEPFNYTNSAETITLYDGGSNVADSPYYVPPTNKSIKLQLSLLDYTNFEYYQLAVIKRTGDAGEISTVDILYPISIDSATSVYAYTGNVNSVQEQTNLDDIFSSIQRIGTVAAHAITDNRAFVAGVTNTSYDWSLFQRYASKVKVRWVKDPSVSPVDTFVRQGNYYFVQASFMEDEIYALGQVFVMEDGSLSPVFHIPGRAPDVVTGSNPIIGTNGVADDAEAWDTGTTTTYGTGTPGSKTKRWQKISTATKEGPNTLRGLMGYHEAVSETYPDITPCDDDPDGYWGRDWQGNLIEPGVTKIRHHRMPGPELAADVFTNTNTHQVGLLISNVEYPPGAVGHYFVYGDRTFEKSILAKGALIPLPTYSELEGVYKTPLFFPTDWDGTEDLIFSPEVLRPRVYSVETVPQENFKTFAFLSSEGILKDKVYSPLYFRLEKFLDEPQYTVLPGSNIESESTYIPKYTAFVDIQTDLWYFRESEYPTEQWNYDIAFCGKIPKAIQGDKQGTTLQVASDRTVHNLSYNISPIIVTLESQIAEWVTEGVTPGNEIPFGSLKIDVDPYTNLYDINYRRAGNCTLVAASPATLFTIFSGDTFVSRVAITDYSYKQDDDEGKDIEAYHISFPTQDSGINYEFRHGSKIDPAYTYFQWDHEYLDNGHRLLRKHVASKYYEETDNVMQLYAQNPGYNDSYSYMESLELYSPLPFNYQFCNDCAESFPYRIYYSEVDQGESSDDKMRIIRPNNYRDIDGTSGPITDLFLSFDRLYATTPRSPFLLHTKTQELRTDASTVYIGTGEVLSLPIRELKNTDHAFGGSEHFASRVITEYGAFYIDSISGRPILLTEKINDLSINGMRNFWQENGILHLSKQFEELTSSPFPHRSTSGSIGYISAYDPRFKRIIVHKRDYKILPQYLTTFEYLPQETDDPDNGVVGQGVLWYNDFNFYYNDLFGDPTLVSLNDTSIFENKSFTISFSFLTNSWISFHSYFPSYMFGTSSDLFTDSLYKHTLGQYQTFYETKYPYVVDIVAPYHPAEIKYASQIFYTAQTYLGEQLSPITYDGLIVYNTRQSTGQMLLIPKVNPYQSDTSLSHALVDRTDYQYRINNIRDITVNNTEPIWDSSWDTLQFAPYYDKLPNLANLNYSKSPYELSRLRDNFVGMRFIFNPTENYKIVTDVVGTVNANRNR